MNEKLRKLFCKLGIHNWVYIESYRYPVDERFCSKCLKHQNPVYDMCYGGTYYLDSPFKVKLH